jgi:hypothetical protein
MALDDTFLHATPKLAKLNTRAHQSQPRFRTHMILAIIDTLILYKLLSLVPALHIG